MKQLERIDDAVVYLPVRMSHRLKQRIVDRAQALDQSVNRTAVELIEEGIECEQLRAWQRRAVEELVQYCRYGTDIDDSVQLIREAGEPLPDWLDR